MISNCDWAGSVARSTCSRRVSKPSSPWHAMTTGAMTANVFVYILDLLSPAHRPCMVPPTIIIIIISVLRRSSKPLPVNPGGPYGQRGFGAAKWRITSRSSARSRALRITEIGFTGSGPRLGIMWPTSCFAVLVLGAMLGARTTVH